jgi:hypothetical protein
MSLVGEVGKYTVAQSVSGGQQHNQHKNTPSQGKAREKGTEFVVLHRQHDFLQKIEVKRDGRD